MDIFYKAKTLLEKKIRFAMAVIISQKGSTPRGAGTKCLILEDGALEGTIGGGRMEHLAVEKSKEVFQKNESAILKLSLTGTDVLKTDMLCGGLVDIFLEPVSPGNTATLELFSTIIEIIERGGWCKFLTAVAPGIKGEDSGCRALVDDTGRVTGSLTGLDIDRLVPYLKSEEPQVLKIKGEQRTIFVETIRPPEVVYLFGAGHISKFVCRLASMVGFRVAVIDDRKDFVNRSRFPEADEIIVSPFSESIGKIRATPSSYIVIVTRGHIHDREVLREALDKRPGYIGMIGSVRKRDTIYASLVEEGYPRQRLDQVHCPVGLMIGAQTPEEIAVSIVAQLIQVRNRKRG